MYDNSNGQIRCCIPQERSCNTTHRVSFAPWFLIMFLIIVISNNDVKGFKMSCTVRSQHGRHLLAHRPRIASSRLDGPDDLESLIAQAVTQGPYLLENDTTTNLLLVDKQVRWTCDNIVAIDGRENYRGLSRQWTETALPELAESR